MTDVAEAEPDGGVQDQEGHCSRGDCPVNDGGECALGVDPVIDCEEYQLGGDDETEEREHETEVYRFPNGEALTAQGLSGVLAGQLPVVVVPLGDITAGKTTLVALIHQLLCSGSMDHWRFAGSTTSVGFARRNFLASIRSKRATPKTMRTSRAESGRYLHLDLRSTATDHLHRLLIADVSGEHVNELRTGVVDAAVVETVGRADHIPIVVSGAALTTGAGRAAQELAIRTMLSMLEAKLKPNASFCVVITNLDKLGGVDTSEFAARLVSGTIAQGAKVFATADRPGGGVVRGHGVEEFLDHLLTEHPPAAAAGAPRLPEPSGTAKRFWKKAKS